MTSPARTPFASLVSVSWISESLRRKCDVYLLRQDLYLFSLFTRTQLPSCGPPRPIWRTYPQHQQLIILCIFFGVGWLMRYGGLDVWTIYDRFCFFFSVFQVPIPCFPKRILRWPLFLRVSLIHGRHSERPFVFGSSVVMYDSEFRACWRWKDLCLFNSPLVASWFCLFSIPFCRHAAWILDTQYWLRLEAHTWRMPIFLESFLYIQFSTFLLGI